MGQIARRYIPHLDGLRGIAVIMVVIHHLPYISNIDGSRLLFNVKNDLRLGIIGVEIFFILSGFLITRILIVEKFNTNSLFIGKFFIKRVIRILPIYLISIIFCSIFTNMGSKEITYSIFFMENWFLVTTDGVSTSFSHTWSVSIEEQFYLVWPFLILWLPMKWGTITTAWILPTFAILVAVLFAFYPGGDTGQWLIFSASPVRMFSLSLGASLAFREQNSTPLSKTNALLFAAAGLALLAGAALLRHQALNIGAYYYVVGVTGFALLAFGAVAWTLGSKSASTSWATTLLAARPIRYVGTISYGLYLYHYIIFFVFGLFSVSGASLHHVVLAIIFACIVASLSYHVIEAPILRLKTRLGYTTARIEARRTSRLPPTRSLT